MVVKERNKMLLQKGQWLVMLLPVTMDLCLMGTAVLLIVTLISASLVTLDLKMFITSLGTWTLST